jgi:hypothetical protein|tara:strand:- start:1988 stop:2353 length:366 start_codon:yes stop_codon:yes gene_type:complete
MSTDCSKAGFSIPFTDEYQNKEKMMELLNMTDEDEFSNSLSDYEENKNQWGITPDDDGVFGLVYIVLSKWDDHYLEFTHKVSDVDKIKDSLPKEYLGILKIEELKVFAFVYYNGSDSPFKF